jgi:DNA-binding winged helix-turn-helix (wHTH) protein/tetratricopeptide (TPR) repeat protein/TolB-like protein
MGAGSSISGTEKTPAHIDLAAEPDFNLGSVLVRPSIRSVAIDGKLTQIEPRVMQVLVALFRATGQTVSREALVSSCWNGVVVGDDAVNRVIGRLRRLAEATKGAFVVETIPRVGFRLTTGGSVVAAPGDADRPTWPRRIFRQAVPQGPALYLFAALAAFSLIIAAFAIQQGAPVFHLPSGRIAVLEFRSTSEPEADKFSARLAARIRQVMSVNDLPSIAHPDEALYRGPGVAHAARKSAIGYLLDGETLIERGDIVVHAELIDARNNLTLWSREFRRVEAESEPMLDQIAIHAAYVLRCAFVTRRSKAGRLEPDALAAFVKACDLINLYDGGRNETLQSAKAVTVRAPRFSAGWSMYAMAAARTSLFAAPEEAEALRAEAGDAIECALKLDRRNPAAYLARAVLAAPRDGWLQYERLIRRALAADPEFADAHAMLGDLYLQAGRMQDAVNSYQRAVDADPLSPMNQTNLVPALSGLRRQEQAAAVRDRLYRIWPNSPRVWMHRLHNAAFPGKVEDAANVLAGIDRAPFKMEADELAAFRQYLTAKVSGDPSERRRAAERYVELALAGRFDTAPAISALSEIGELDRAFLLAREYLGKPFANTWVFFSPPTEAMRADPRFIPLLAATGLVDFWTQTGQWPDFCYDPDLPYNCRESAHLAK